MKTIKLTLLLAMFTVVFSCSKEQNSAQFEDSELSTNLKSSNTFEKDIIIEWHEGVKEDQKDKVRHYYKDKEILSLYKLCEEYGYEFWTINCPEGTCGRESDTPVETDDDVKRISFDLSLCENLE